MLSLVPRVKVQVPSGLEESSECGYPAVDRKGMPRPDCTFHWVEKVGEIEIDGI